MRLRGAVGFILCAAGALASSGCGDDRHIPVYEVEVVDRTAEREREREPAPYVLPMLLIAEEPGRVIYEPPPFLGDVAAADTIVQREQTGSSAPDSPARQSARDTTAPPRQPARDTARQPPR